MEEQHSQPQPWVQLSGFYFNVDLLTIDSQIHSLILRIAKLSEGVPRTAAISDKDVQEAVLPKEELSSVVVGRRLRYL